MIKELGNASLLIFLAEMGDKTQILAMAFALKYSVGQVLFGVACGSFLNHGLAVLFGSYLGHLLPLATMRLTAGLLFLLFGLWALIPEQEGPGKNGPLSDYPILAVAFAFFVGELGDKTQLTAITLASKASFPLAVLGGTVLGMVLTSCVGIAIGTKLGDRVPELALKLLSSGVFIGFGLYQLWTAVPAEFLTPRYVVPFLLLLAAAALILLLPPFF
ncbi:MAG TPA: TMEM165/GDT1 family protein, partial [Firmicutes bacterium]|nr:TMEM165/GDT1 family protein [Bacillota bacterium]